MLRNIYRRRLRGTNVKLRNYHQRYLKLISNIAVQFDIGDLHEAITKAKAASQEHKSTTDKLEADIACVKAECDKLGKHNHGLETKIAGSTG